MCNRIKNILFFCIVVSSVGFMAACETMIHSKAGTTTTVIMIRHADRTPLGNALTERGHKNARALVDAIGKMDISAIYSPDLVRNLDTVRPLAKHLAIKIKTVDIDPVENDVVLTILEDHAGKTVLWVGNTTNLPGIYHQLGGRGEPPVKYGDLFILTVRDKGVPRVVRKTWGENK